MAFLLVVDTGESMMTNKRDYLLPAVALALIVGACFWLYWASTQPKTSVDILVGYTEDLNKWADELGVPTEGRRWFSSSTERVTVEDGVIKAIWRGETLVCVSPSPDLDPSTCIKVRVS